MKFTERITSFASPIIKRYEEKRQQFLGQIRQAQMQLFGGIISLIMTFIAVSNNWLSEYPNWLPFILGAAGIGIGIYSGIQWRKKRKKFTQKVLKPAIQSILKNSERDWKYLPFGHIDKHFINQSHFFKQTPTSVDAEILLEGSYQKNRLKVVKASCARGHGKNRREIFNGLMIQVEMQFDSGGVIAVLPDTAQRILGKGIGKKLQSWSSHKDLKMVYFEDVEFENKFVVYAKSETHARKLLSPEKLELFKKLSRRFSGEIYTSFHRDELMIGVSNLSILSLNTSTNLSDNRTLDGLEGDFKLVEELIDLFAKA